MLLSFSIQPHRLQPTTIRPTRGFLAIPFDGSFPPRHRDQMGKGVGILAEPLVKLEAEGFPAIPTARAKHLTMNRDALVCLRRNSCLT